MEVITPEEKLDRILDGPPQELKFVQNDHAQETAMLQAFRKFRSEMLRDGETFVWIARMPKPGGESASDWTDQLENHTHI